MTWRIKPLTEGETPPAKREKLSTLWFQHPFAHNKQNLDLGNRLLPDVLLRNPRVVFNRGRLCKARQLQQLKHLLPRRSIQTAVWYR